MGQKVNPIGFRVGVKGCLKWPSRWFARSRYADLANEDIKIRSYLLAQYKHTRISSIDIERSGNYLKIIIYSALPGYLIGKKGQDIENLKKKLSQYINRSGIEISVQEVTDIYLSARVIAQVIAEQIERRISFKKAIKKTGTDVMKAGAKGIKICVSGRLDGSEIARSEWVRLGSVSLHTLRSNIDYSLVEAKTTYGIIGVKVWISKGNFQNMLYV